MIGAIAGDIIGSIYEWHRIKVKDFPLFSDRCHFTDDSVHTIALADAILSQCSYVDKLHEYFDRYPHAGYGGFFRRWASNKEREPYNSYGNGAAMRISPVGFAYDSLEEVLKNAEHFTAVTHNHPEGIKGGQAVAASIFMAKTGQSMEEIRAFISEKFGYDLTRKLVDIRPEYSFNETCQGTVPEAITAFLESTSYEDAVRNAVSLGGDSDTLAAITGGIADAYFGVPDWIQDKVFSILDNSLCAITRRFQERYPGNKTGSTPNL
jgi:ADP-ribosylglycohydrolase